MIRKEAVWKRKKHSGKFLISTIYLSLVPSVIFARLPYREGYYDGLSGGKWEDFVPPILIFLLTVIIGRRDMIKNGISFDSDAMDVGAFFAKWFIVLMGGFIFSLVIFGGLIEIIIVLSGVALIGLGKTKS